MLRPFVGLERTRARLDDARRRCAGWSTASTTCARAAARRAGRGGDVEPLAAKARRVAREACAPPLGWIADWADALRAGSLEGAVAATDALDAYGEHYTAARLMVDALIRMPDPAVAEATAARLRAMGALASAAELSGSRAG